MAPTTRASPRSQYLHSSALHATSSKPKEQSTSANNLQHGLSPMDKALDDLYSPGWQEEDEGDLSWMLPEDREMLLEMRQHRAQREARNALRRATWSPERRRRFEARRAALDKDPRGYGEAIIDEYLARRAKGSAERRRYFQERRAAVEAELEAADRRARREGREGREVKKGKGRKTGW